ncbi:MAG: thioredoxin family protein [Bacteroidota bacterium]
MKQLLGICFLILLGTQVFGQRHLEFQDLEWSEALSRAKAENKLIFLNGMAQWSQPCKLMEEYIFTDPEVGEFYNSKFINLSVDMEAFPGTELAERYQVYLYPTLLFIDGNGTLVHRGCGAMESAVMLDLGKTALDPDARLIGLQKKYDDGNRNPDFLASMSDALNQACLDQTAWVDHFFSELEQNDWTSQAAWTMISLNVQDPFSPYFQYLMKYHDLYALKFGKDTVDQKIYDVLLSQFTQIYEGEDLTLFAIQALKSIIRPLEFTQKDELEAMVNLQYAEEKEDWDLYCESAIKVVKQQGVEDPEQLNEFAWKIYVFSDDEEQLNKAKGWIEPLLKEYEDQSYMDTYASLLYKLGDPKSAIKWEKRAIRQAEQFDDEDLLHYQLQLERFESGL